MSHESLTMGRKLIKFMRIHSQVVQLEIVPFLTGGQARDFSGTWFGTEHLTEVQELLQSSVDPLVCLDRQVKDKDLKKLCPDCLVGSLVRLGFNIKRKPERQTLLIRRTKGGHTSCRVFDLKLVVYVCPRLHSNGSSANHAFSQLLTGSSQKSDQTEISKYFHRHHQKPAASSCAGTSTHRSQTSTTTTTTTITTTSATNTTTTSRVHNDRTATTSPTVTSSVLCSGNSDVVLAFDAAKARLAPVIPGNSTCASVSASASVSARSKLDSKYCDNMDSSDKRGQHIHMVPNTGNGNSKRNNEAIVASGGKRTALKNMLQRKCSKTQLTRKKLKTAKQGTTDRAPGTSGSPSCYKKFPSPDVTTDEKHSPLKSTKQGMTDRVPGTSGSPSCYKKFPSPDVTTDEKHSPLKSTKQGMTDRVPGTSGSPCCYRKFTGPDVTTDEKHSPLRSTKQGTTARLSGGSSRYKQYPAPDVTTDEKHLPSRDIPHECHFNKKRKLLTAVHLAERELTGSSDDRLPHILSPKVRKQGSDVVGGGACVKSATVFPVTFSKKTEEAPSRKRPNSGGGEGRVKLRKKVPSASVAWKSTQNDHKKNFSLSSSSSFFSSPESSTKCPSQKTRKSRATAQASCKDRRQLSVKLSEQMIPAKVTNTDLHDTSNVSLSDADRRKEIPPSCVVTPSNADVDESSNISLPDLESDTLQKKETLAPCSVSVYSTTLDDTLNLSLPDLKSNTHQRKETLPPCSTTFDDMVNVSLPDLKRDAYQRKEKLQMKVVDGQPFSAHSSSGTCVTSQHKPRVDVDHHFHQRKTTRVVNHLRSSKSPTGKFPSHISNRTSSLGHTRLSSQERSPVQNETHADGLVQRDRPHSKQHSSDVEVTKTTVMNDVADTDEYGDSQKTHSVPKQQSTGVKRDFSKEAKNHKHVSKLSRSHSQHVKQNNSKTKSEKSGEVMSVDVKTSVSADDWQDCYVCEETECCSFNPRRSQGSASPVFHRCQKSQAPPQPRDADSGTEQQSMTSADRSQRATSADRSRRATSADRSRGATSADRRRRATSTDRSRRATSADRSRRATSADRSRRATSADRSQRATSADRSPLSNISDYNRLQHLTSPSREQHSVVLTLSDEELERRVFCLKEELMAVYKGDVYSNRHRQYMMGGVQRRKLDHQVHLQYFREGQEDVVMDVLLRIFTQSQFKNLDFMMRVMLPEALMRIYKQVTGTSWDGEP